MKNRPLAVLFDMDGTILNTLGDLTDSVNASLRYMGYPVHSEEEIRSYIGDGVAMLVHRSVPAGTSEEKEKECYAYFCRYYEAHKQIKTCPYPGVADTLAALKKRGYLLGVVSNKYEAGVKELAARFFPDVFDVAVGDSEKTRRKPWPDMLLAALDRLGVERGDALFIGDSPVDIETAKNAGVPCLSVLWGYADEKTLRAKGQGDFVSSPAELLSYL